MSIPRERERILLVYVAGGARPQEDEELVRGVGFGCRGGDAYRANDEVKTEALAEGLECTLSVFSFSG